MSARRRLGLLLVLLPAACRAQPSRAPAVSVSRTTDVFEALYAGEPLLFETDPRRLCAPAVAAQLAAQLGDALAASPDRLSVPFRITLQNDVWGLWQRLDGAVLSSPEREQLRALSARLVLHLAPDPDALRGLTDSTLAALFPTAEGWRERGIGVPDLLHDRLFGHRRHFRLFTRGSAPHDRALINQLVAIDRTGALHATALVGGVERILPSTTPLRVEVFDRDRAPSAGAFVARQTLVQALPGLGTNGFLVRFPGPRAPTPDVCIRCHHTLDEEASFTAPTEAPDPARNAALLQLAARDAHAMLAFVRSTHE